MMMALFPTLKGAARPITTPITTYHHIKHAPATSHKNQVNSLYTSKLSKRTIHKLKLKLIKVDLKLNLVHYLNSYKFVLA